MGHPPVLGSEMLAHREAESLRITASSQLREKLSEYLIQSQSSPQGTPAKSTQASATTGLTSSDKDSEGCWRGGGGGR
ncbi:hypothetical protein MHYP_G00292840 [Metynnis hypsauchen]